MSRQSRLFLLAAGIALGVLWAPSAFAQRRGPAPPREPRVERPARPVHRGLYVFVGGYFYDPYFGPYPWWSRRGYPYMYFPVYDNRAEVRVLVTPKEAAVYVDGFYAGIVDDFNGFFQRLPLPPGGHEIVLYLDGFRTMRERIYLAPGSTFKLQLAMARLRPNETSEPPTIAPPVPPPPDGSYLAPHTAPRRPFPPPAAAPPDDEVAAFGMLVLRVQPADADISIDGERWLSSEAGSFTLELAPGRHQVRVTRHGFKPFSADVEVRGQETTPLNVSLAR